MARQRERAAAGALRGVPSARHSRGRPRVAGQAPRRSTCGLAVDSGNFRVRRPVSGILRRALRTSRIFAQLHAAASGSGRWRPRAAHTPAVPRTPDGTRIGRQSQRTHPAAHWRRRGVHATPSGSEPARRWRAWAWACIWAHAATAHPGRVRAGVHWTCRPTPAPVSGLARRIRTSKSASARIHTPICTRCAPPGHIPGGPPSPPPGRHAPAL